MKRKLAWFGATFSGLYLLTIGLLPFPAIDPLPFIDEVIALAIFLKYTSYLGYDLRERLRLTGKKGKSSSVSNEVGKKGVTILV